MFKEISMGMDLPEDFCECECRFYKEEVQPPINYRMVNPKPTKEPENVIHIWIEAPTWLQANLVKEYCVKEMYSPNAVFQYNMKKTLDEPSELIYVMSKSISITDMMNVIPRERENQFRLQRQYCETVVIKDQIDWCEENGISPRVHFINLSSLVAEWEFKFGAPEDKVLFDLKWRHLRRH